MRLHSIDGHTMASIAYNEDKPGIPIIFIHGLTDSVHFWEEMQTPQILENRRWYSVSLPGHYPAQFPGHFPFTAEHLADITYRTIRQLVGDEPFILAGVSTGGFIALNVASHYPDQVCGIISISGFIGGWWHKFAAFSQLVARLGVAGRWTIIFLLNIGGWSSWIFRTINLMTTHSQRAALTYQPDLPVFIERSMHADFAVNPMRNMYLYIANMRRINLEPHLPCIKCPTLVIWCDHDPFIPRRQARRIVDHVPQTELVVLENTGHFPMWENPAYHSCVAEWLDSHNP
ncbi:MAG: alpha/beta hydrolase [Chloroflexi bacterium]|nr:alpha/beta hydrolase [Chloroflexota bacterium]